MGTSPRAPQQPRLPESASVFDTTQQEFEVAYRKDFKRTRQVILINNITFDNVTTSFTGVAFEVPAYAIALICINLGVTLVPTDIVFNLEFSCDKIVWFKYMRGPFGDLRYEDAAGAKTECLDIPILAKYMRCRAVATGTSAVNMFTATVTAVLNG
jgi:hypothetical protein